MPVIDLSKCFPEPIDPKLKRGPLPKQSEFIRVSMDLRPNSPKFIRYIGGVGSGKTLSGCFIVLSWAIQYPGEYLISRQYMPELKLTTLKTFLDICPPELIAEHRIADSIIRIKCVNGGVSDVIFRGLDEPDKLRSLNLNAAYIDESAQTSEAAFLQLQSRLRGRYVRKIILTSNSGGRDWNWRYFVHQDMFKSEWAKKQFYSIKAPSTENVHLPEGYVQSMLESWSEDRIKREILADEESFTGQVYTDFRRDLHVVKPFRIPDSWDRHIRIDHGFRNPTSVGFYAISPEGEVYKYREFYEAEWLIHEIMQGKRVNAQYIPGIEALAKEEKFVSCKIDPSTKNRRGTTGTSDYDEYYRLWPKKWPILYGAKNDVQVGIDRVKSYLKPHHKSGKPLLYFFDTCVNTIDEISSYKYPELKPSQEGRKSEHEKPIKVNDHACDELRYLIIDLPDPTKPLEEHKKPKNATLERAMFNELERIKNPRQGDPFGD